MRGRNALPREETRPLTSVGAQPLRQPGIVQHPGHGARRRLVVARRDVDLVALVAAAPGERVLPAAVADDRYFTTVRRSAARVIAV